jgi:hypothetical protein
MLRRMIFKEFLKLLRSIDFSKECEVVAKLPCGSEIKLTVKKGRAKLGLVSGD